MLHLICSSLFITVLGEETWLWHFMVWLPANYSWCCSADWGSCVWKVRARFHGYGNDLPAVCCCRRWLVLILWLLCFYPQVWRPFWSTGSLDSRVFCKCCFLCAAGISQPSHFTFRSQNPHHLHAHRAWWASFMFHGIEENLSLRTFHLMSQYSHFTND